MAALGEFINRVFGLQKEKSVDLYEVDEQTVCADDSECELVDAIERPIEGKSGSDDPAFIDMQETAEEQESEENRSRRLLEIELIEKYRKHRIALQEFGKKLSEKEKLLLDAEKQVLEEKKNYKKLVKGEVDKYVKKKKLELEDEAYRQQEKARRDLDDLKEYKEALYKTEYTIIDWLKRVDRKERAAFEEIMRDVKDFQECNKEPPKDGIDFEKKFANALTRAGFENVQVTEESGDFGADIVAEKDGVKYVIQCKYYSESVGVKSVQQVFASKIHYSAHVAVVATNSVFTKSAKVLAQETGVLLWNGLKVQEMMCD